MSEPSAKRRRVSDHKKQLTAPTPTITDPRFANIQSDPRFKLPSKRRTQVKVDKRFSRVLKDEDFARKAKVDRYGRPTEAESERQRLKRRFDFEDDEDDEPDSDDVVQRELQRVESTRDRLREGALSGSSSEESSNEADEEEGIVEEFGLAEHLEGDVPVGEASSRLAVVNLDWDNIRAEDLMAVFSSFLPAEGRLLRVAIYPSEFGKERMEREEMEGPPEEIFAAREEGRQELESTSQGHDDEDEIRNSIIKQDKGEEFDSVKLRQYQLERLRYFYAVLTFSSLSAAKAIYDAVDGTEYLSTANFFDLRFIPDETDFSSDKPREECEKISDGYKPNEFVTDALQHSKVKLTWDADDVSRKEVQARAFRRGKQEIDENDLKAYLGTDSEDSEGGVPKRAESATQPDTVVSKKEKERQRMRALLGLGAEPATTSKKEQGPVGDIQVTFSSGLSGGDNKASVFENEPETEETTMEKYIRKERERKQKRKQKSKQTSANAPARTDKVHAELAEDDIEEAVAPDQDLGFDDPFFTAPENDKASASKIRKEERLKKRAEREAEEVANAAKRAELELLMVDDKNSEVKHFDMKEIEKAEKRAKKKGKQRKKDKSLNTSEAITDDFSVDTQDPRFAPRLFENHEFAIDPTNPKFRGTAGMKAILDEGRKRRAKKNLDPEQKRTAKHEKSPKPAINSGGGDVRKLVEKVKKRNHS